MNTGTRLVTILASAVSAAALLGSLAFSGSAAAASVSQVQGNVSSMVGKATFTGHYNPRAVLGISVALSLQNTDKLYAFLHDLRDPASPSYHKYLTPKQFTALYCPSAAQVKAVETFLTQRGIKVTSVSPNNMRIHGSATTAVMESAFGVASNNYKSPDGTTFYSASTDPSMPSTISGYVTAVMGLDDAVQLQPHYIQATATRATAAPHAVSVPAPAGFSPQQIATAYNWPLGLAADQAHQLTDTTLASGVTLAIATAYSFRQQDLTYFWSFYGLPTHTIIKVPIDGVTTRLEGETTLDIQRSGSLSPGSTIVVYEAANPGFSTFDDEFVAIANDVTNHPQVVSTSWGAPETVTPAASVASEHSSFVQLNAEGITVLAAAGDNGAADGTATADRADFPASDPYVLAAGGTHLVLDGTNNISSESAWSTAGGADSEFFAEPAFQTSAANWVSNPSCSGNFTAAYSAATQVTGSGATATPNLGADGCAVLGNASRQSSDMSMDADPGTGYALYFDGRWAVFGGTSFVAPELAGLFAILVKSNGGAVVGSGPELVFCNAAHTESADFNDIVLGQNSPTLTGTFIAGTGWDHPTGWEHAHRQQLPDRREG